MNKEVKERWIAALKSGEYKQGTGKLCQSDKNGFQFAALIEKYL